MARMTYRQIVADIQRKPGLANLSLGEIVDNIAVVSKDLGNQPWPWNYAETNVLVPAPFSTGTISVTDGTDIVTLAGAAWTGVTSDWRIRFSNSNLDYMVLQLVNPTTIELQQVVNLGTNLTNVGYFLYRDSFTYPTDYIVGSDVALLQPTIRTRINKVPRYKFEMLMNEGYRSFSTTIQMFYCDHGQSTSGLFRFRLGPPPAGVAELRLCYHAMSPDFLLSDITKFPEGYDEIILLTAASKLYDLHKQPGLSEGAKALAAGKIRLLKRQIAAQTIDDVPNAAYEVPDSSISQWGMMIGRVP